MKRVAFFFRLFFWFSLRFAGKHAGRTLIVVLGIALGAAVFTSVRLSIHASMDAFSRSMDLIAGQADRSLIKPGGRVPETLIKKLLQNPNVAEVSPVLMAYVHMEGRRSDPFLLIGFDPLLDRSFRNWQPAPGSRNDGKMWIDLISRPFTLAIGDRLARQHQVARGDMVVVEHSRKRASFRCVGILDADGLGIVEGGRMALTDIATFQEFTGHIGRVDRIDLRLAPDAAAGIEDTLGTDLPAGVVLARPEGERESGMQMIRAYQLNLSILSFVSLFVGMFLVYSLIALNAANRRRELAILHANGASAQQVFLLFLLEGAMLGVAGWLVSVPVGSVMVRHMIQGVSETISTLFVRVHVDRLVLSGWEIALSFGVTLIISLLAAAHPARTAMRISPKEVMADNPEIERRRGIAGRLGVIGLLCVALVLPLAAIPGPPGLPLPGYLATFLLFTGFSLLSPWCLQTLGRHLARPLRRIGGEPAFLAGRYLGISGMRAAISVGALITASALFCALVIMIYSFRHTVEVWVHQTISGDVFVRPKMASMNQYRDPIPTQFMTAIQQLDVPVDLLPYHRIHLRHGDVTFQFETVDIETFRRHGGFIWVKGEPESVETAFNRGEGVLVSEVYANLTDQGMGSMFRTRIGEQVLNLPILGIVRDYRTRGGVVFYAMTPFNRIFGSPNWGGVRLYLDASVSDPEASLAALMADLMALSAGRLEITSGRDLRRAILRIFDETFAVTSILLLIALVVAALGIASTLSVLVLERSREFNTMIAVGASNRQIRRLIFWEAMLMVIAGEVAGVLCGFVLSYLLIFVINAQSFGWTFQYRVDWGAVGLSVPLIIGAALSAALPASRLIFREPPAVLLRER